MQPSACVASAYVAAAGERACSSGARLPAPGVGQCGSSSVQNGRRAAAPHRWSARLHACPASNEGARHVVSRPCFGGRGRGGRIAYARCNAARGRNVTAPCTLNMLAAAACARRSAAGVRRQAHRYLGRHHHATAMTWAGWTRHVTARASERRERLERIKGDGGGPCTIFFSRLNCDRLNCAVSIPPRYSSNDHSSNEDRKSCKGRHRSPFMRSRRSRRSEARAVTCRVHPAQVMTVA